MKFNNNFIYYFDTINHNNKFNKTQLYKNCAHYINKTQNVKKIIQAPLPAYYTGYTLVSKNKY